MQPALVVHAQRSESDMTDQELDARFKSFASEIRADIRADIKAEGVMTRGHFDIVVEGLTAQIKVIADGHEALRADVAGLKVGQERLERGQERLEIRQLALEHRQGRLEERQGRLEECQGRLEERQGTLEEHQESLEQGQRGLVTEIRLLAARLPA
jgi:hypothetical protein